MHLGENLESFWIESHVYLSRIFVIDFNYFNFNTY